MRKRNKRKASRKRMRPKPAPATKPLRKVFTLHAPPGTRLRMDEEWPVCAKPDDMLE